MVGKMITDLHLHTNYSDGKLSVSDTIKKASESEISVLSITDHDSIVGVKKAIQIAKERNIICLSGLELSCRNDNSDVIFPTDISIHILAYNIDYESKALISYLKQYHHRRKQILSVLIEELEQNGFDVKYEDIDVIAGKQMRIQDIINHINSSFAYKNKRENYLRIANDYYSQLFMIDCPLLNAIEMIKSVGGQPILAHAFYSYRDYEIIKNTEQSISTLLDYLCEIGLSGVEVFYSKFSEKQTHWMLKEAQNRGLLITAGSDFHGTPLRKEMMNYEIPDTDKTIQKFLRENRY
jgi:predicted metal-dependent phosphoesterase TrpH